MPARHGFPLGPTSRKAGSGLGTTNKTETEPPVAAFCGTTKSRSLKPA